MSLIEALRVQLETAGFQDRLTIYADADPEVVAELRRAGGAPMNCAEWLTLRGDAGPPGRSLPTPDEARQRLWTPDADLPDATALWLTPGALDTDATALLRHLGRYLEIARTKEVPTTRDTLLPHLAVLARKSHQTRNSDRSSVVTPA